GVHFCRLRPPEIFKFEATTILTWGDVVCPARFDEWLKGLCDPSPFSVTGYPGSDQQRIALQIITNVGFYSGVTTKPNIAKHGKMGHYLS
ncbi:hypothetical protein PTR77_25505, partial [Serratia bockelmannii]|uniref:hypothetical protein n=1 Tax=Serratia bockelmannii TaxID=2703793 RepID=UPI00313F0E9A